ncbi:MAG: radical SAM protein [Anaerolinea sp.]|nr:radical SAM protein [Anaerolinea sp.]
MNIQAAPDPIQKIALMAENAAFESAGDAPQHERPYQSRSLADCITNVSTPKGKKPVLKSMITTACEKNCFYCPFRAGRSKTKRVTITPDQMAKAFDDLQRAKIADGIFLSSGIIKGGTTTQDKIIDTIEIIRRKYGYRGYVHLKVMPGSEYDQLARAMQLADRVSINLEAPTQERLHALAPKKDFAADLLQRIQWAHEIKQKTGARASIVTQFVVGAVGDTDLELLSVTEKLHRQMSLARAYFSAFSPVIQTPLENVMATLPERERRLYQASFLVRDYNWSVEELNFTGTGNLPLDVDPKKAWADANLTNNPVDLRTAERAQLLRVPGIGPKGAEAILKARMQGKITELVDLRKIGIAAPENAAPYVLIGGKRPPMQERLF